MMTEHSGPDWKSVSKFAEQHWPYLVVGAIVLIGLFYTLFGAGSSAGTAATTAQPVSQPIVSGGTTGATPIDPGQVAAWLGNVQAQSTDYVAALNAQSQQTAAQAAVIAAQIGAASADTIAAITGQVQVQQANANAASGAYIATVQNQASTANYAEAALTGQNIQALQSLTTGFSNYAASTAQSITADATAAAGTANPSATGTSTALGAAIGAAGLIGGAINGAGWYGNLSSGLTPGNSLLPNITSVFRGMTANGGNQNFIDSGTWDVPNATAGTA